jgi:hypothetical protein
MSALAAETQAYSIDVVTEVSASSTGIPGVPCIVCCLHNSKQHQLFSMTEQRILWHEDLALVLFT